MKNERFLSLIEASHSCWNWNGYRDSKGYGGFYKDGKMRRAHRISFELFNGPIKSGNSIIHTCDNPTCVNPDHLRQGTHQQNMDDAREKGRFHQQKKTRCKNGHPFTAENTRFYESEKVKLRRSCKTCERIRYENSKNSISVNFN